jgi:hypothetical protein
MAKPKLKVANIAPPPAPMALAELHSTFKWTRGADVQAVWRRHGWQPPTEYRSDYEFRKNRELQTP